MATLYLGAKGHTAQQIAKVFHFNTAGGTETTYLLRRPRVYSKMEDLLKNPCISLTKPSLEIQSNIHSRFQALNQEINKPTKNVLLRSFNQLYGDKSVSFQRDFSEAMKKYYNAEPQTVNFQDTAEYARKEINLWAEHQTAGKILNLLNEGSINPLTRLIMVNVLYFKGNWSNTFKKEDTTEQPFRLNKSTSTPIKMMYQHNKFNWKYIDEVQAQILELQYMDNDFSMFILLPDDINDDSTGLEMLEDKLTYETFSKWTSPKEMEEVEANVHLPKMQLNIHFELKSLLTNMGITDAFSSEMADFTGMLAESNLGPMISVAFGRVACQEAKMNVLLLLAFIAALSAFLPSETSPVIALAAQNSTFSRLGNMDSLSAANITFALNLFKKLSVNDSTKNLFFSPLSMSSALLMVSLGARGNTEAQMLKVLSVSKDGEVHQRFEKLISEINKPGANYSLSLASRLFGEESYDFLESFIESTQKFYHAGLEKLNFHAAEYSRRHINAWVEEKTTDKIQNLLAPGIIHSLTKLVLVNAIYFKGNWANKFNKDHTQEKPFQINKNETKTVQMMFRKGKYSMTYISDYRTSILEIPYAVEDLSMFILLPDKIEDNSTGLEKLEREITYEKLKEWLNPEKMIPREIELSFPKFKLEEEYDLKPVLRSMGMTDAFDEGKADFSGMNHDASLSDSAGKSPSLPATSAHAQCKGLGKLTPAVGSRRPGDVFLKARRNPTVVPHHKLHSHFVRSLAQPRPPPPAWEDIAKRKTWKKGSLWQAPEAISPRPAGCKLFSGGLAAEEPLFSASFQIVKRLLSRIYCSVTGLSLQPDVSSNCPSSPEYLPFPGSETWTAFLQQTPPLPSTSSRSLVQMILPRTCFFLL
ncbi:leukocyte elastase inhibitor-like [Crotalus adamanteus]|uniref:Leukocyte elastase inhibitor n=1 Tax=Crotalus adamanteus TaxID=8729 RepID=A0AAW1BN68_CROAD